MLKRIIVAGLFLWFVATVPVAAAAVSVLVIETGQPTAFPGNQYSVLWENGLLEVFFDSGHIVTNAPLLRLDENPAEGFPDEAEQDFNSAREGGMEYFVISIVDTIVDTEEYTVYLRLFSTKSQKMIQEQIYKGKKSVSMKDEYQNIKKAAGVMSAHLNG